MGGTGLGAPQPVIPGLGAPQAGGGGLFGAPPVGVGGDIFSLSSLSTPGAPGFFTEPKQVRFNAWNR